MDYPIKVFEIKGFGEESIKLEILEVFGFPNEISFRGGYDIRCNLEITSGLYTFRTEHYYSATSALYDFYVALLNCYNILNGKATYNVYCAENDFVFEVTFNLGQIKVNGKYKDDPIKKNFLNFEFGSDQSYFKEVLSDLKKIVLMFGDKKGIKN